MLLLQSPADVNGKVHIEDKVIQVNEQNVVCSLPLMLITVCDVSFM